MSFYATVEGVDGAGKTTLIERLKAEFPGAVFTAEPKESQWTGAAVREALQRDTSVFTDAFLFMADRAEHLRATVRPALEDGLMVVSDRSADSTYAYQTHRMRDHVEDPMAWYDMCYGPWDTEPDLTLWLDVPLETAMSRLGGEDKYENEEMLNEVIMNYETLSKRFEHRYHRLDATKSEAEVADEAVRAIRGAL